jgi:hypothetical protein
MAPGRKRKVGVGFVVVIAALLAFNGYVLQRNQRGEIFAASDRFAVRPRNIGRMARLNTMQIVKTTFAAYHLLRTRLAGAHLRLPARLEAHQFALEHVSRLHVELGPQNIELPSATVHRLFDTATEVWSLMPENLTGVLVEPGAADYVMVSRPEDYGLLVIISEARYQRELAESTRAAPAGATP